MAAEDHRVQSMTLTRGVDRVELALRPKAIRCKVNGAETGRFHSTEAGAARDWERLVKALEADRYVRADTPAPGEDRIELYARDATWLAVVDDAKLTVTDGHHETTSFLASADAARRRAQELAGAKRASGYRDHRASERDVGEPVTWSKPRDPSAGDGLDFITGEFNATGERALFLKKGTTRGGKSALVRWLADQAMPQPLACIAQTSWSIESICRLADQGGWLAVGADAEVLVITDEGQVSHAERFGGQASAIDRVRFVAGAHFAVGMGRAVFRRSSAGLWHPMNAGLPPNEPGSVTGFCDIAGFSEAELYAAGWGGELWRFNGSRWSRLVSGTEAILTSLVCADERVFAVGRSGTVLVGRGDSWRRVAAPEHDFWGAAWFRGALYLSSLSLVFRLEDEVLKPVNAGSAYHLLRAGAERLVSVGARELEVFDGDSWEPLTNAE